MNTTVSGSVLVWTSETPIVTTSRWPQTPWDTVYVQCRTCYYDKPLGWPCGLPCV